MRNNPTTTYGIDPEPATGGPAPVAARETIYAMSSGRGRAGVAVLRLSGAGAGAALTALAGALPPARQATVARLRDPAARLRDPTGDPAGDEVIDQGLILWFPGPGSFTGEDVAELHLHGGRAVVAAALGALGRIPGLRPAEAGEFTRRAFDNGKLDLSQAEGLADLIDAETEAQRRQAVRQLGGTVGRVTEDWRRTLVTALAHLETTIDFADEDLESSTIAEATIHHILCLKDDITQYIDNCHRGERLRDGLSVAIVGAPNVGKSSLLNALARRDAAIVSDVAGTTRDVIEVPLDLDGYPVILADTAGLHGELHGEISPDESQTSVEAEGMRRARARAATADLKLVVLDIRDEQNPDAQIPDGKIPDADSRALIDDDALVVLNKRDLVAADGPEHISGRPAISVSATTGAGLEALEAALAREAAARLAAASGSPLFTRARHRRALEDCVSALERVLERALSAPSTEFVTELAAEDVRLALRALGRIAGRTDVEDVLDVIFRDFCIGK